MTELSSFRRGLLAGMLLMLGGQAVNWFIGGGTPDASTIRTIAVALQAIVGFGGAWWLYVRQRSRAAQSGLIT
jgi:hypothetical protein